MVFIDGEDFTSGSGSSFPQKKFAIRGKVIACSLGYRVGSLGFLSTEDEESAGNYGLWDLITALRWLKINIKSFGGDTDRITVVGSTTTISMLLESSYTQGLFSKVIAQGGGPSPLFLFDKRAREKTQILAKNMDCESDSIKATIRCMGDVDARNFVSNNNLFRPVLDWDLYSSVPLSSDAVVDVDYLGGMDIYKGRILAQKNYREGMTINEYMELVKVSLIPYFWGVNAAFSAVDMEYFTNKSTIDEVLKSAEQLYSDMMFNAGHENLLRIIEK